MTGNTGATVQNNDTGVLVTKKKQGCWLKTRKGGECLISEGRRVVQAVP